MNKVPVHVVALVALVLGIALVLGGVYLLAGAGWTLLAGGVPCLAVAGMIFRGILNE